MGVQISHTRCHSTATSLLDGVGSLDGGWETVGESAESSQSQGLGLIVLESKSLDGLGGVVYFFANLDLGVVLLRLGVLLDLLDTVVWLVGQGKGENSSEVLLGLFTMSGNSESVGALASVVEASHVVWCMAELVSVVLHNEGVISLGKSPDNRIWLTHLPIRRPV